MIKKYFFTTVFCLAAIFSGNAQSNPDNFATFNAQQLSGTKPIEWTENYFERNSRLITEFLDKKIAGSESSRTKY
jgi:hypothetical protein